MAKTYFSLLGTAVTFQRERQDTHATKLQRSSLTVLRATKTSLMLNNKEQ